MDEFFAKDPIGSFIQNQFVEKKGQKAVSLVSSVNQDKWKKVHLVTEKQIDQAIQSAYLSFLSFRQTTAYERAEILKKVASLLRCYKDKVARIITTEMGKTLRESYAEIEYSAGYFEWFAEEAKRVYGYSIPSHAPEKELNVHHEPVGVVGVITPWNFPVAMAARKVAPAIAAGCTAIVKPSPETPYSLLTVAAMFFEAGLQKGALSVLIGDEKKIGKKLLESPRVRKITFTGSTAVGKYLYRESAETLKKLTLELGGHAPVLVFDDADLDSAVEETVRAKFRNNGETCAAANRIFLQKGIEKEFISKLVKRVKKLKVRNPFLEEADLSTILHPLSLGRIPKHIKDAKEKGAKVVLQGQTPAHPTILTGCTSEMKIFQEETFGPTMALSTFKEDQEGVALANDTPYGLAAYVMTRCMEWARLCRKNLRFGFIGINDGIPSAPHVPFGGIKYSGFGREGGPSGIYEYLVEKFISQKF